MSEAGKAQLQIHFCVLLWGFTAILGKLISLSALPLVWWRMVIVIAALALVPRVWRTIRAMSPRLLLAYAGIGVLVALHWLTFYGAIKLANASVAATSIALATPFTAVVEPWISGGRFSRRDLLLGVAVLPGVVLLAGGVPQDMWLGIAVGALSALFVALFGALNKRFVHHGDALTVTAIELGAGTVTLTLLAPLMPLLFPPFAGALFDIPSPRDIALLLTLAFVCTLLPFALSLVALRHMSAFAAQLAVNLEPLYTIAFAALIFGEQRELGAMFYVAVAIILTAVFAHPFLSRGRTGEHPEIEHPELLATAEAKQSVD